MTPAGTWLLFWSHHVCVAWGRDASGFAGWEKVTLESMESFLISCARADEGRTSKWGPVKLNLLAHDSKLR